MVDKILPNDPRIQRVSVPNIRGNTYTYLLFTPPTGAPPVDTVVLLHGFPDLSLGWRYQIPALLALNLRVVVPDNLGYGRTDSPHDVSDYSLKNLADDTVAVAAAAIGKDVPFILGGHDWGAGVAWRVALWHPQLVKAIFCACVPFAPPREGPAMEDIIRAGALPNFKYQLQFIGPDVEREIRGKEKIRQFLSAIFGGRDEQGNPGFTVDVGAHFDRLEKMGASPLVTEEELEYYVDEMARNGMRGPLNWYRASRANLEDEQALLKKGPEAVRIKVPTLFIAASKDSALPPSMAAGMGKCVDNLTMVEVDASHWVLWQKVEEVNGHLKAWLEKDVLDGRKASL
ncbi:related to epoxide hydrolase [Cephalotrichum gorgonifer]|uniref:Related to epoxide hydrolase n=1 Tax=Cephalotrichum gorgonifer TaxID=2041049 RepID=A0AAE8MS17_9PEZI|nr:related to epoxide hydrolase [Cephalotrichum gorgonifer]